MSGSPVACRMSGQYLRKHAQIAVAPLQIGRGVQNKVLEAMAMGLPVVATPQAREGLDFCQDDELLTAASPAEFAAAIGRVLDRSPGGDPRGDAGGDAEAASGRGRGRASSATMAGKRLWRASTGCSLPSRRPPLPRPAPRASKPFPLAREPPMTVQTPKIVLPIATPSALRDWLPTLLGITAFCALFGVAFQHEIAGAIRVERSDCV